MFTLQGGNFQSGGVPVANGSVILTLSNPFATIIATGGPATPVYTLNLDANGNLPAGTQVLGNAELTPGPTFYSAQLFTGPNGSGTLISTSSWPVGPSASYAGMLFPNVMVLPAVSFVGAVSVSRDVHTFSATPAFNATQFSAFEITLTGNVTSSTLSGGGPAFIVFEIIQDGVGGRSFVWPTNVKHPQSIDTTAAARCVQAFYFDGTNAYPMGDMTVN